MDMRPRPPEDAQSASIFEAIHRGLMQQGRLLKLDTPLGANTLIPIRAQGWAKIGRDYRWTLEAASTRDDLALLSLMHQPVTLWIQESTADAGAEYRPIQGFVNRAALLGMDGGLAVYQIEFASALYFLGYSRDDRFWLEKTAADIVSDVLNRYPQLQGRFRFDLSKQARVRSYCRQAETDLNFVSRILEDEGWYYYWAQSGADDKPEATLVIVDRVMSLPESRSIEYYQAHANAENDGFSQWASLQVLQSLQYTSHAFDYTRPRSDFKANSALLETTYQNDRGRSCVTESIPFAPLTVFEQTSYGYSSTDDGESRARVRSEVWDSQANRSRGVGGVRWIDAGARFTLEHHPRYSGPAKDREFVAIEVSWLIENNVPIGRHIDSLPLSLRPILENAKSAYGSRFACEGHEVDGSVGYFVVDVEVQRANVQYRSPLEHSKPVLRVEHARVNAPKGEEAWADKLNRVRVRFAWDRQSAQDAVNTSPLLLSMQSDTGSGYGAVHVPRANEWVAIDHFGGDCDRPFIIGRLPGGETQPPWNTTVLFSGFQSRGFGNTGAFNAFVHDDATNQGAIRLTSYSGGEGSSYSLLHQGYLIAQEGNTRGRYLGMGYLLHADHFGAIRANRGLYIGTHHVSYNGEQLDVTEARKQLANASSMMQSLSDLSTQHKVPPLSEGQAALQRFSSATQNDVTPNTSGGRTAGGGTGSANGFKDPVLLLGSPAGIAASTPDSIHLAADMQMNVASGKSTHLAVGESLIAAAAKSASLFAGDDLRVTAAKGALAIEAHGKGIDLIAQALVRILSAGDSIEIASSKEILITSGGASIRLKDGNIELHAPGKIDVKGSQHEFSGPASTTYQLPQFKPGYQARYILRNQTDGSPMIRHAYEMKLPSGRTLTGHTNDLGETVTAYSPTAQDVSLRALEQEKVETKPWHFAGGGQPQIFADYMDEADSA
ncbi:type VI secretion system tip protein VgrG (plasmid) [Burkholderia vietnamiensis]|uniref:Rhs element Vgr protein n=1 Tax=Burkholderia vietnamiensis (strain G4 / LMG 22486) TaxID=269482 RepID=A4JVS7_BURVG|nr:Rhs element Vgr protein [Burkholderia vietnamiensis G4]MCB4349317.1 type VI secretion system tip protein VgrG [Burkholderia vietnamiensis]